MSDIGNKKIFSQNLQFYMSKHKKDRQQVCDDLDLKYTTFSDWFNGNKYPRIDKIELLANYFGIEKSDLIEEKKNSSAVKGIKIPVLGYVRAGIPIEAVENILDYEEISLDMASKGEHFALSIKGDSMEPKISEGDVVIVRKQDIVENGELAVVLVNGNDATVKKFYMNENGVSLISTNSAYDPFYYTKEQVDTLPVRVIGKVVELRAKF